MNRFLGFVVFTVLLVMSIPLAQASYGKGLWFFGGLGEGVVSLTTSEVNPNTAGQVNPGRPEQDKLGFSLHVKAGPSWYFSKLFVADAMIGWDYSSVTGKASAPTDDKVKIQHQVAFFSLSPRYRFGDEGVWQLGPLYKLKFGTDTSYTERVGQNGSEEPMTHYLGLHLNYDLPSDSGNLIYRFGLEPLMDISNSRTIMLLSFVFEMGFTPFGDSPESYSEAAAKNQETPQQDILQDLSDDNTEELAEEPLVGEEPIVAEDSRIAPEPVVAEKSASAQEAIEAITANSVGNAVFIKFPSDSFLFDTGMSHISSLKTRNYLKELGHFLASSQVLWQSAKIVGHTDRRGPRGRAREVNMELSTARATTVKNTLVAGGMEASKVEARGAASDEPVPGAPDNEKGWRLNRRVTLTFQGVDNPQELIERVNTLNKKYGYGRLSE